MPVDSREVTDGSPSLASEDPLAATIATEPPSSGPAPIPTRVDRYDIDRCIGSGAMGMVLRAHDPRLDRVVAIKLLRSRVDSDASGGTTRLLREARALAKLSHPNVIDVYDVGTVDGKVFIAMEYVAGPTLDAWLKQSRPSRAEVLDAFVQAGRGLAAAHAAGLVHRDFKPTNVLRGEDGRVRVVDFGLAAPPRTQDGIPTLGSLDGDLVDVRVTATGFVVGTPAYMAPEAHCGEPVDAYSDQFSFCVSLFEALWGQRPFDGKTPKEVAAQALNQQIRFPPGVEIPASLRDVVLRGLSPSPADRWPTMDALLGRLQPRRRAYWPWLVAGGGATLAAVLLLVPPPSPTTAACHRQAEAIEQLWAPEVRARVHAAFAGSELAYAEDTWTRVREHLDDHTAALAEARRQACEASADASTTPERLDDHTACLDRRQTELRGVVDVLVRADATTVRNAVRVVGDLRSPQACRDDARAAAVPPPPLAIAPDVERARDELARVRAQMRAGHYDRAQRLAEQIIERAEPLGYAPLTAEARFLLSRVLEEDGQYEAALLEMSEAQLIAQEAGHDALVARSSTQLIFVTGNRLRRPEQAKRWVRHARAAIERLSDPSDAQTFLEATLGNFHWARGELDTAVEHFERALTAREERLGPRHGETIIVRSNLAMVHHERGDTHKARAIIERTLADRIEVYGPTHPDVATNYGNLAVTEQILGDLDAAVEHTQRSLDILEASVGREHPNYPQMLMNQSNNEYFRGNVDRAIQLQEQARDLLAESMGPRDFLVGRALGNLGAFYHEVGRNDEARATLVQARSILDEHLPPGHPEIAGSINNLANVDRATGRLAEALAEFGESIDITERALGADHPDISQALLGRAAVYQELSRFDEALADQRRAVAVLAAAEVDPERVASARRDLATGLWAAGQTAEAIDQMKQARALIRRPAKDDDDLPAQIDAWLAEHRRRP